MLLHNIQFIELKRICCHFYVLQNMMKLSIQSFDGRLKKIKYEDKIWFMTAFRFYICAQMRQWLIVIA